MIVLKKPAGAKIISTIDGVESLVLSGGTGSGSLAKSSPKITYTATVSTIGTSACTTNLYFTIPYNTLLSYSNYGVLLFNAYASLQTWTGGYSSSGSSSLTLRLSDGTTTHTIVNLYNNISSASSNTYKPNLTKTGFVSNIYLDLRANNILTGNGFMDAPTSASQYSNSTGATIIANNTSFASLNLAATTLSIIVSAYGDETGSSSGCGGTASGYFSLIAANHLV